MIRQYSPSDFISLITLIRKNIPEFFDPSEEVAYASYLEKEREDYFVFEEDEKLLGAGGINYFLDLKTARISWDLIDPDYHGKGIGSQLLEHRLRRISSRREINTIEVRTSQMAFRFYEKHGFDLEKVEKDYWAEGFDLYLMLLKPEKA